MSLKEAVAEASHRRAHSTICTVERIPAALPPGERAEFAELVKDEYADLTALARVLHRDRKIGTSARDLAQALNRHRRGDCKCP